MAMNFNRPAGAPTTAVAAKPETALMEVQPYDIIADQQVTQGCRRSRSSLPIRLKSSR